MRPAAVCARLLARRRPACAPRALAQGPARAASGAPTFVRTADRTPADTMDLLGLAGRSSAGGTRPVESLAHLTKQPSDSYLCVELPFGRDASLRSQYVNFRGQLRVGKLLEELDAFAGAIAYRHCSDGDASSEQPTLVTASTDRVDLISYPLLSDVDMQMRGMVTYVGTSSLNIDLEFLTVPADGAAPPQPVLLASTTFVARNSRTGRALPVPRLAPSTPHEARLFDAGRAASEARKAARGRGLDRHPPSAAELAMVHQLFQELSARQAAAAASAGAPPQLAAGAGRAPPAAAGAHAAPAPWCLMEDTLLTSTEITMPQDRNIHGKVFGGWLMRRAFETAWAAGWRATGALPKFLALDDLIFSHPVEVGSMIRFDARLVYSLGAGSKTYCVSVTTTMSRPHEERAGLLTNTFSFVFYTPEPERLPRVYPRSYAEAMDWIEAERRMQLGRTLAERRKAEGVRARFD